MEKTGKTLTDVFKYILPIALSAGLCYYLYTKIDMDAIREEASRCDYWLIGGALVVAVFSHIFRAMRWRIQLSALGIQAPLKPLVWSIFGTYAINLLVPRLGELWRTGYIAKRQDASFTQVFGSMVADRLADTATVLLLTFCTFFLAQGAFIEFAQKYPQVYQGMLNALQSPWAWVALGVIVAVLIWLFAGKSQARWVVKVRQTVTGLWKGFAVVGTMPGKGRWLLLTAAIWGCYFSQLYMAFYAFDFTAPLGITAALVAFVLSSISMGIPSNGGLGPWHLAIIFALGLYGIGMNQAAAFAMIVWGSQNLFVVLLGLYAFASILTDNKK